MYKLGIGSRVTVLENAFEGSDDPRDFEYRGKTGEITEYLGDGCFGVYFSDGGFAYLKANELSQADTLDWLLA